jgi:hypothetical protein
VAGCMQLSFSIFLLLVCWLFFDFVVFRLLWFFRVFVLPSPWWSDHHTRNRM